MNIDKLSPKDLRVGSIIKGVYLNEEGVECYHAVSVVAIDSVDVCPVLVECIEGAGKEIYVRLEPLELSGEWLIRLGFLQSKSSNICYDILDDNGFISIFSIEHWTNSPDVSLHFWYCKHMIKRAKLQYVHQVQNIFHSLSLCELEIKIPLTN